MVLALTIWCIICTAVLIHLYFEPKFDLRLVQDEEYNHYTLYLCYIIKADIDDVKYGDIKLFSFKIKKSDKRRT